MQYNKITQNNNDKTWILILKERNRELFVSSN